MSDLFARLAKLPPEKRRLLEQRLKGDEPRPLELLASGEAARPFDLAGWRWSAAWRTRRSST